MRGGPHFVIHPSLSQSPPPYTHKAGRSKERELSFRQQFGSVQSGVYEGCVGEGFSFLGYLVGS